MDPIIKCDWDEIQVPAKIQDLIERNIRTLSNSISSKSQTNGVMSIGVPAALELLDLKERWLTKKELQQSTDSPRSRVSKQICDDRKNDEESIQSNPTTLKLKTKKPESSNQVSQNELSKQVSSSNGGGNTNGQLYNLKEHSVNIRIKYNRQSSKD